jgi:hypothetical protein
MKDLIGEVRKSKKALSNSLFTGTPEQGWARF